MQQPNWKHLMQVALAGAATAVIADYIRHNYTEELNAVLGELSTLISSLVKEEEVTKP